MKTTLRWLVAAFVLAGSGSPLRAAAPGAAPAHADSLQVTQVTLVVGHRVFTAFRDRIVTPLDVEFVVGDSEYSAEVVEFQPDFTMDLATRRVSSRTQEPRNPAVRVIVSKNGAPDDTSWAFLKMPPHYGRRSMLAFQLTKVEFANHAAVEADSVLLAPRPAEAPKSHTGGAH